MDDYLEMKCPKCNYELEIDDCFDTSTSDEWFVEKFVGHCPICDKEYQWKRKYKFYNEDELVECN